MIAITYVGNKPSFMAKVGKSTYEFEWKKSRGIGSREDEIPPKHAQVMSSWRNKKGKKLFNIE